MTNAEKLKAEIQKYNVSMREFAKFCKQQRATVFKAIISDEVLAKRLAQLKTYVEAEKLEKIKSLKRMEHVRSTLEQTNVMQKQIAEIVGISSFKVSRKLQAGIDEQTYNEYMNAIREVMKGERTYNGD